MKKEYSVKQCSTVREADSLSRKEPEDLPLTLGIQSPLQVGGFGEALTGKA